MRKYCLMVSGLLLALSAHAGNTSLQYFLLNPKAMNAQYQQCTALPMQVAQSEPACVNALNGAVQLRQMLYEGANQGQQFGQKLMQVESALVKSRSDLKNAEAAGDASKVAELKQQIKTQEFKIQSMMVVIRLLRPHE